MSDKSLSDFISDIGPEVFV